MLYVASDCYEAHNPTAIFESVAQTPCMIGCISFTGLFWYNYLYQQSDDLKSATNHTSMEEKKQQKIVSTFF